ncbi:hypothetical protein Q8F55_002942 [Vanrija albida]|uniref:Glycosyltransferase family 18 catalytic domain-containing protein n=1 Tax=Vanrija albida TaxID=181172 RepID=A0ABR3QB57_9TREE
MGKNYSQAAPVTSAALVPLRVAAAAVPLVVPPIRATLIFILFLPFHLVRATRLLHAMAYHYTPLGKQVGLRRYVPPLLAVFVFLSGLLFIAHQSGVSITGGSGLRNLPDPGSRVSSNSLLPASGAYHDLAYVPHPHDEITEDKKGWMWYNDAKLRSITACMARGDCHPNAAKIVIFNVWYCKMAMFGNYKGGEGTWCVGMTQSLERQGYTVLFADDDWEYTYHIYRQFPDLIRHVVSMEEEHEQKFKDWAKTKDRPWGIPHWKHFRFHYYQTDGGTVVGNPWVVTCEPEWRDKEHNFRNFTYLGYSIEKDKDYIPFEDRPMRAYVLGKHQTFFYPRAHQAWGLDYYKRALDEIRKTIPKFEMVGSFFDERNEEDQKKEGPLPIPEGIRNLPKLGPKEFDHELRQARLLLGIGHPTASPSPYRALARGVPFLSPFKLMMTPPGTEDDPNTWSDSQHDTLRTEQPPLVYNVLEFNYTGMVEAIKKAMVTPIEPYVYERMLQPAFDERMRNWMEADWETEARRILDLRLQGTETQKTSWVEVFEM